MGCVIRRVFILPGIVWLGLCSLGPVSAAPPPDPAETEEKQEGEEENQTPKVTDTFWIDGEEYKDQEGGKAYIGSEIRLNLEGNFDGKEELIPFINGVPLAGNRIFPEGNVARFKLRVTNESKDNWLELLSSRTPKASLSIGPVGGLPYVTAITEGRFEIGALTKVKRRVLIGVTLTIVVFFLVLASRTAILRAFAEGSDFHEFPWSLARVQWGGWICIISISFFLVWLITGMVAVNSTALLLLGISTGTIVGAQIVGDKPLTDDGKKAARKMLGDTDWAEQRLQSKVRHGIKKFVSDLISDQNGKSSLNRFQMLIFTVLLWGIYVTKVVTTWTLPEYDNTILGLMGISSGTYVGFKFKETNKAEEADAAGTGPGG